MFLFLLSSSQYFIIWRSLFYFINVQLFKNCLLSFYDLLYFKQIIINSKSNSITFHSFQFTHNFCPKFFSIQRLDIYKCSIQLEASENKDWLDHGFHQGITQETELNSCDRSENNLHRHVRNETQPSSASCYTLQEEGCLRRHNDSAGKFLSFFPSRVVTFEETSRPSGRRACCLEFNAFRIFFFYLETYSLKKALWTSSFSRILAPII